MQISARTAITLFNSLLIITAGLTSGALLSALLAGQLALKSAEAPAPSRTVVKEQRVPPLDEFSVIVSNNLFNPAARGQQLRQEEVKKAATTPRPQAATTRKAATPVVAVVPLTLIGTVEAGKNSLAAVEANREVKVYHLGHLLPGNATLIEVARQSIRVRYPDGRVEEIRMLSEEKGADSPPRVTPSAPPSSADEGVSEVGENRWVISREEAEEARSNIGALMKAMRVEPHLVNGQTSGFVVRMIRSNTIVYKLGVRRGDIIKEINGLSISGPEQALMMFQQLKEAKNISLSLERSGTPLTFNYEIQ